MTNTICREIFLPQPREQVWEAISGSDALAGWMYPNDFEPRVGHRFTFRVPAKPEVNFEGLVVQCEVLECEAPGRLVFSWSAGGPVVDTRVSFRLEPEGVGTRLFFEHSGFDLSHAWGERAFKGAGFGWAQMLGQLAALVAGSGAALRTERVLDAGPGRIFAALQQPDRLARWWGPRDFTNTFERFEFQPGGRWVFVMHGPNGADYPNESVFREIEPDARVVIEHVSVPRFTLSVTLTARGDQTHLAWVQEFETPEVAAKIRAICEPANEENLDRLQALLAAEESL